MMCLASLLRPPEFRRRSCRRFRPWPAVVLLALVACEPFREPELDLSDLYAYSTAPLAVALSASAVNDRVNYPVIERSYRDYIDKFIELCADDGPRTKPAVYFDERYRAAYYINVHNGLIVQTWLRRGAGSGDLDLRFDPAWLDERIHHIDGRTVSINDVAELAMRQGFVLVPIALASGTITGPPLPSPPVDSETLARSLDQHARAYLSNPRTFERVAASEGDTYRYYAPSVLADHAERFGDLEAFIDKYVDESHPFKLDLLRAAHDGSLGFRPHSNRIHLPDVTHDRLD